MENAKNISWITLYTVFNSEYFCSKINRKTDKAELKFNVVFPMIGKMSTPGI